MGLRVPLLCRRFFGVCQVGGEGGSQGFRGLTDGQAVDGGPDVEGVALSVALGMEAAEDALAEVYGEGAVAVAGVVVQRTIAPDLNVEQQRFRVTHPFHPWFGREFALVTYRFNWGEERVYFHDDAGRLTALPARWTSVLPADPFVVVSAGRSPFRFAELRELARLIQRVRSTEAVEKLTGRVVTA